MKNVIGIRKETKDKTQRRAPLSPQDVRWLTQEKGLRVLVEPWDQRIFTEDEYRRAGATMTKDLSDANVIFGVKEVAPTWILRNKAYMIFSHVTKGQAYNMPMLRHMLRSNVSLFDYELVKDRRGKRTIAFGDYAGYAGLIDSLWALGKRLSHEGIPNPFDRVKYATSYNRLDQARSDLKVIAKDIRSNGLHPALMPLVVLVTGYGRVSTAAMELLKMLPVRMIDADKLYAFIKKEGFSRKHLYVVQTRKEDLYTREARPGTFDLSEFNAHPDRYKSRFAEFVPYATMIINGIYWKPRFPRILTKDDVRSLFRHEQRPRLRVIGDITCDIGGSIEITVQATTEKDPVFVYRPTDGTAQMGWKGRGPVVLAVDKLPNELPWEASSAFSHALAPYVPLLARADMTLPFGSLRIISALKNALVTHRGTLTPGFTYLTNLLDKRS